MERNRTKVALSFESDGFVLDEWESFSLRETYIDPLSEFSFVVRPQRNLVDGYRERLAKGEAVRITVNDANQGRFLIVDSAMKVSNKNGVAFSIKCQSFLATPYQGGVNPRLSFSGASNADVPIGKVVLDALAPYGFTSIVTDSAASASAITGKPIDGRAAPFTLAALKDRELQAQHGETAYQFAHRFWHRVGVQMRTTVDGDLLLEAPDYEQDVAYTVVQTFRSDGPYGDFFLDDPELTIEASNDGQYSECTVRGTAVDADGAHATTEPTATVTADTKSRAAYSSSFAPYKPKFVKTKNARDVVQCKAVANLALSMGAEKAFSVTGAVDGLVSKTGRVWACGTMARVVVEAYRLDEPMFLLERTMTADISGGQRTLLKFIPKGALNLGEVPS